MCRDEKPDVAESFIAVVHWVAAVQPVCVALPVWTPASKQEQQGTKEEQPGLDWTNNK